MYFLRTNFDHSYFSKDLVFLNLIIVRFVINSFGFSTETCDFCCKIIVACLSYSIGKPSAVTGLKCTTISSTKMMLSWYSKSSRFIVRKTVFSGNQEREEFYNILNASECEVVVDENNTYDLEIRALSDVGDLESEPTNIKFPQR